MELQKLKDCFHDISHTSETDDVSDFLSLLTESHTSDVLEYHYSLLNNTDIDQKIYNELCRKYVVHGEAGEIFLLKKIHEEKKSHLRGICLQILGSMRYSNGKHLEETTKIARGLMDSSDVFLRNRAILVLGWIGDERDIELLKIRLSDEIDLETRGLVATSLMQLFYNNKTVSKQKIKLITILKTAMNIEKNDSVLNSILLSIQEISNKKLGLSSTSHQVAPLKVLENAKRIVNESTIEDLCSI